MEKNCKRGTQMEKNVHANHRERMRQRYLMQGPDGFATHELLEMLLYYSIPRSDTNDVAHRLLEENRGLIGMMSADINALGLTEGVGEKSAMLLSLVGDLLRRAAIEQRPEMPKIGTFNQARGFIEPYYVGVDVERVYVLALDNGMRVIDFYIACEGSINEAYPITGSIARRSLLKNASGVIIAHNHPDGFAIATSQDRDFTSKLEQALKLVGVVMMEHLLFGGGSCIPILQEHSCMLRSSPTGEDTDIFYDRFYANMETGKRELSELLGM